MRATQLVGLFGGTFDPIHNGHLAILWEVYELIGLDVCHIIPAAVPPHRETPEVNQQHRLQMLQLALTGLPQNFVLNDCELQRQGKSYSIDTITHLQDAFPDKTWCLIIGMDAFLQFTTWHRWQEILEKVHLVVAHRPNYDIDMNIQPALDVATRTITDTDTLHTARCGKIRFLPVTQLAISATRIREQLQLGYTPRFLMPDAVLQYIRAHHLYGYQESLCKKTH